MTGATTVASGLTVQWHLPEQWVTVDRSGDAVAVEGVDSPDLADAAIVATELRDARDRANTLAFVTFADEETSTEEPPSAEAWGWLRVWPAGAVDFDQIDAIFASRLSEPGVLPASQAYDLSATGQEIYLLHIIQGGAEDDTPVVERLLGYRLDAAAALQLDVSSANLAHFEDLPQLAYDLLTAAEISEGVA